MKKDSFIGSYDKYVNGAVPKYARVNFPSGGLANDFITFIDHIENFIRALGMVVSVHVRLVALL